jgi:hypothetical protein
MGKAIFLFFIAVMTTVAIPAPGSYPWGGGDGRTTETSAIVDLRSGEIGAS